MFFFLEFQEMEYNLDQLNLKHKNRVINNFRVVEFCLICETVNYDIEISGDLKTKPFVRLEDINTHSARLLSLEKFSEVLLEIGEAL